MLLVMLIIAAEGVPIIENPNTTLLMEHPRSRDLVRILKACGISILAELTKCFCLTSFIVNKSGYFNYSVWRLAYPMIRPRKFVFPQKQPEKVTSLSWWGFGSSPPPPTPPNYTAIANAFLSPPNAWGFYRQALWMKLYGHMCLKRTLLWSTSPAMQHLDLGKIRKGTHKSLVKTAEKYLDGKGVVRYKGTGKTLKGTQFLGLCFCIGVSFTVFLGYPIGHSRNNGINLHCFPMWGFIRFGLLRRSYNNGMTSWLPSQFFQRLNNAMYTDCMITT